MSNFDKYVAEYINSFEANVKTYEAFKKDYLVYVDNKHTDVLYSNLRPEKFLVDCETFTVAPNNKNIGEVLTRYLSVPLQFVLYDHLFKDLEALFEKGFKVERSDSYRLVLVRPDTLFEGLEDTIKSLYEEYKAKTTLAQREEYMHVDKITAYVEQEEEKARLQAIESRRTALLNTAEKLTKDLDKEQRVIDYLTDIESTTTSDLREALELSKQDLSDAKLGDILKLHNFEKKRSNSGNVWKRSNL
ncbi:hypothetical protein B5G52_04135 [Pseudoalteromonas sp. A601]|uniref:hypothetical protein n=1 Tax=Pseudoalteromonas sp. A601 TaxID=1967839 RepID=UPI000B3C3CAE|nr:hypothetical protein [Pseudoalteromonas sp. A601]OUS73442.1 hypothetical protein B5G52_04135 [Pseudoalteromonas sp. A601]